jgi:hypothetical protein
MIDEQDDDSAAHGYHQAVQIQATYPTRAQESKKPSPNDSTHDTEQNIGQESGSLPIHDLARDESGQQTQQDPSLEGHKSVSSAVRSLGAAESPAAAA